jgi:hypothetical protein
MTATLMRFLLCGGVGGFDPIGNMFAGPYVSVVQVIDNFIGPMMYVAQRTGELEFVCPWMRLSQ